MSRDLARITDDIAQAMAARAGEALYRLSPEGKRQRQRERARRRRQQAKIARRLILSAAAILLAAVAWGLVVAPIGVLGVMAAAIAIVCAWVAVFSLSSSPAPTPQALAASDLPLLPQRTEEWLVAQRPALPAPAVRLVDTINLQLEAIAPQLHALDPAAPLAQEFRKLVADELPELVQGYTRVPEAMRRQPSGGGGTMPDRQLVDGLGIVKAELDRMSGQLASGDLDRLATQNRYLELKYRGPGEG